MKKFFIFIIFFFISSLNITFADIIPDFSYSIHKPGIGVLNLPNNFIIYQNPDFKSKVIRSFDINLLQQQNDSRYSLRDTFIASIPAKNLNFVTVNYEDGSSWFEIFYDQKLAKTGWVFIDQKNFFTWKQFFDSFGRKYGLYLFRDLNSTQKQLYSSADDSSSVLEGFTLAKHIKLLMIKGNFMLVNITDLNGDSKIGYLRFRSDNGSLFLFPFLK